MDNKKDNGWISCKDELPEMDRRVMVFNEKWSWGYQFDFARRLPLIGFGMWPRPTHWMPIEEIKKPLPPTNH